MIDDDPRVDDIVVRAVTALRNVSVPEEGLAEALARTKTALATADAPVQEKQTWIGTPQRRWRCAAAVAATIAVALVWALTLSEPSLTFAAVMDKLATVQTLHLKFTTRGKSGEAWLKRPNRLREQSGEGKYEISNGPIHWVVDEEAGKAVQKPSLCYRDAQRRGVDILEMFMLLPYDDNWSGFFSEGPVDQIERAGRTFDVFRMELERWGKKVRFKTLVDRRTQMLHSMELTGERGSGSPSKASFEVLAYDQPIPDEFFEFRPKEGMTVEKVEDEPPAAKEPRSDDGATLSGRIVWAKSGKPVSGATVTVVGDYRPNPEGGSEANYLVRARTNRNGQWLAKGAPACTVRLSVRSWEWNWPSVPTFATNVGTAKTPKVCLDGHGHYRGLNFRVCRPGELFARITINVTDDTGAPVAGAGATLWSVSARHHGWVYAARGKQFTGPDGKIDSADVWPTHEPVAVTLLYRDRADPDRRPYASYASHTKPFIVEPKKRYHFDMVLPRQREATLKIVNRLGEPLAGISITVLAKHVGKGHVNQIFPLFSGPEDVLALTDEDGLVHVNGLAPDTEVCVLMRRLREGSRDVHRPQTTRHLWLRVPRHTASEARPVTFDERPIVIEGTVPLAEGEKLGGVFSLHDRERGLPSVTVLAQVEEGRFVVEGAPACDIALRYHRRLAGGNIERVECLDSIRTEPGHKYRVEIRGDRMTLLEKSATE